MEAISEEFSNISVMKLVQWGASAAMIFGGVVPYVPQYRDIQRSGNADGFSLHVCLALLIANILRILYWVGHGFELPLLAQSIIMIFAMLVMVNLCVGVKKSSQILKSKERLFSEPGHERSGPLVLPCHCFRDFDPDFFWKWTEFQSYVECMLLFGAVSSVALFILHESSFFVELIGVLAVFTESLLGVPQMLRNHSQRSTHGMSVKMVLMWLSGDSFKTFYFILRSAPRQFTAAGVLQVCVDLVILCQVWLYGSAAPHAAPNLSIAPRHKAHELVE